MLLAPLQYGVSTIKPLEFNFQCSIHSVQMHCQKYSPLGLDL